MKSKKIIIPITIGCLLVIGGLIFWYMNAKSTPTAKMNNNSNSSFDFGVTATPKPTATPLPTLIPDAAPATDFVYEYSDFLKGMEIIDYSGDDTKVYIPNIIEEIPVVSIGTGAFNEPFIESIICPDTIYNIQDTAFKCANLKHIDMPGVTDIGWDAFLNCPNLESANLSEKITNTLTTYTIVFSTCSKLKTINDMDINYVIDNLNPSPSPVLPTVIAPLSTVTPSPEPTVIEQTATPSPEPTIKEVSITPSPTPTINPSTIPTGLILPTISPSITPMLSGTPTIDPNPSPNPSLTPSVAPPIFTTATPAPSTTATQKPTKKPEPTATPVPTTVEKDYTKFDNFVANLVGQGDGHVGENYYSLDNINMFEKPCTEMKFYDRELDGLQTYKYCLIDSTHQACYGEDCINQYAFTIADNKQNDEVYIPNLVYGVVNKLSGEFVFADVNYDSLYRYLTLDTDTCIWDLEFSTGENAGCCFYTYNIAGKATEYYINEDCSWSTYMNIRFSDTVNTDDWEFFVTTCDMETWEKNESWYKENFMSVVPDFYGNLDKFHTEGATISFWAVENNQ